MSFAAVVGLCAGILAIVVGLTTLVTLAVRIGNTMGRLETALAELRSYLPELRSVEVLRKGLESCRAMATKHDTEIDSIRASLSDMSVRCATHHGGSK